MDSTRFLYNTAVGNTLLPLLTAPKVSRVCGAFLDSPASGFLIPWFVKANHIDLSEFHTEGMQSFNDCFSRKIREGKRPVDPDPDHLIAPCDGLLKAFPVKDDIPLTVKEVRYTLSSLLHSSELAARFEGGTCLVFRLCVNHYHRYCYMESGEKSRNVRIPGRLHTVRPAALEKVPVFAENSREYTLIRTEGFGTILQMEVGAMLVGRICNYHQESRVCRGQEKGYFQYGGSTVIALLQPGRAMVFPEYFEAARRGDEIAVRLGQMIGERTQAEV